MADEETNGLKPFSLGRLARVEKNITTFIQSINVNVFQRNIGVFFIFSIELIERENNRIT